MTKSYGLIGSGMMGQEHIRNVALLDGVAITDVFEPNEGMRNATRALLPEVRFHDDLVGLLSAQLDALVIASPNYCHADQLIEIAQSCDLPVLVEKPVCTNLAQATALQTLAKDRHWWVAMEYRYMPPIMELRRRLDLAGQIHMLSICEHRFPFLQKVDDWNRFNANSGGTLVEKCCHFFDLMRLLLGSDPVRVMVSGGQAVNHLDESYPQGTPDILDHAYVIVDFASGQRACLELSMFAEGSEYQEMISIVGDQGKLEALVPGPGRFWKSQRPAPVPKVVFSPRAEQNPQTIPAPVDPDLLEAGDHNGSTFYQHRGFFESLSGGPVEVSFDDGLWAVRMGLAAQESIATGQAVELTKS
ncbi:MAG: Gfo/Idh/MocA family protein [Litorivicinus sp.]